MHLTALVCSRSNITSAGADTHIPNFSLAIRGGTGHVFDGCVAPSSSVQRSARPRGACQRPRTIKQERATSTKPERVRDRGDADVLLVGVSQGKTQRNPRPPPTILGRNASSADRGQGQALLCWRSAALRTLVQFLCARGFSARCSTTTRSRSSRHMGPPISVHCAGRSSITPTAITGSSRARTPGATSWPAAGTSPTSKRVGGGLEDPPDSPGARSGTVAHRRRRHPLPHLRAPR